MRAKKRFKRARKYATGIGRGGFTVPMGTRRPRISPQQVPLKPMGSGQSTRERVGNFLYQNVGKDNIRNALMATGAGFIGLRIKNTEYMQLPQPEGLGPLTKIKTAGESHETSSGKRAAESINGKVYHTKFDVGRRATKAIRDAARQNGTDSRNIFDTKVKTESEDAQRSLVVNTGFNQKACVLFTNTAANITPTSSIYWSFEDIKDVFDLDTFTTSPFTTSRVYADSHYFGTKITVSNINKYLDMKVKITWYKQSSTKGTVLNQFKYAVNPLAATQVQGAIPIQTQLTNEARVGYANTVKVDARIGGLASSDQWQNRTEKVKSFTKVIKPGDDWIFDYRHHTGSGLRIDRLSEGIKTAGDMVEHAALGYFPIIELVGGLVECYNSQDSSLRYNGTAPGAILVNWQKYLKIGNRKDALLPTPTGPGWNVRAGFRVYEDAAPLADSTDKIFSVSYSAILKDGETPAAGKYIVPGSTDLQVVRAGGPA